MILMIESGPKKEVVANATRVARSALVFAALCATMTFALTSAASADPPQTWYVNGSAPAGGNGSSGAPFNTLAAVQDVYGPGDTIMIEPSTAVLNGGIVLLPGQRLIGDGPPVVKLNPPLVPNGPQVVGSSGLSSAPQIENTTTYLGGDAVELASDTTVQNLVITGAVRGGIYGQNALGVTIVGNDISGFNSSGTTGFVVQPFCLEQYEPGVANCIATGLPAGWAGIMVDTANGNNSITISNNYVHNGVCGDGIDVRGMNTGNVNVREENNFITQLVQCSKVSTIEGLGTQVTGTAQLQATLVGNTEANTGSPGANMDSLFVNPAQAGTLTETITNNVYMNGIGGPSTNGLEFILSNGSAKSQVTVSNSFFQNNPGDMLEEFDRGGVGSTAVLTLNNVTVEQTTFTGGIPSYADPPGTATTPDNTGECLGIGSVGANDTTILQMTNSSFTGCDNNGIEVTNNHPTTGDGTGNPHKVVLVINHSTISGSRYYNLWLNDVTPLTDLSVLVQNSNLSGSISGIAAAFDVQPTTGGVTDAKIDLGGGMLGSVGGNCIYGGQIYNLEATALNVYAKNDWWGSSSGPLAGSVHESTPGFTIVDSPFLTTAPPACP
jgi:hypothetical protein